MEPCDETITASYVCNGCACTGGSFVTTYTSLQFLISQNGGQQTVFRKIAVTTPRDEDINDESLLQEIEMRPALTINV